MINETNSVENTSQQLTSKISNRKKSFKSKLKTMGVVILGLTTLLIVGYLIYSWIQNNERRSSLDQANSKLLAKVNSNASEIDNLNKELKTLKAAYDTTKSQNIPNNLVEVESVISAFHLDTSFIRSVGDDVTYGKDQRGYNTAYIEVSIINKGAAEGFISNGEFKLKDDKDVSYEMYTEQLQDRAELHGKQLLVSQSLEPKERVVGLISFKVPPESKAFKLYFKEKVYDVTLR